MKNIRTPRTLADSTFECGYTSARLQNRRITLGDVLLAVAIGVALAFVLVYGGRL